MSIFHYINCVSPIMKRIAVFQSFSLDDIQVIYFPHTLHYFPSYVNEQVFLLHCETMIFNKLHLLQFLHDRKTLLFDFMSKT